mmetsp:Transcript_31935/g.67210  ORF Transcript_31935/g.67210 Transcript_31935/m.67210 type:complete len:1856 (+) Transcript_31935:491-6058(+)
MTVEQAVSRLRADNNDGSAKLNSNDARVTDATRTELSHVAYATNAGTWALLHSSDALIPPIELTKSKQVIGRGHFHPKHRQVSKSHFTLSVGAADDAGQQFWLTDHSVNGTFLNGMSVAHSVPQQIRHGDIIALPASINAPGFAFTFLVASHLGPEVVQSCVKAAAAIFVPGSSPDCALRPRKGSDIDRDSACLREGVSSALPFLQEAGTLHTSYPMRRLPQDGAGDRMLSDSHENEKVSPHCSTHTFDNWSYAGQDFRSIQPPLGRVHELEAEVSLMQRALAESGAMAAGLRSQLAEARAQATASLDRAAALENERDEARHRAAQCQQSLVELGSEVQALRALVARLRLRERAPEREAKEAVEGQARAEEAHPASAEQSEARRAALERAAITSRTAALPHPTVAATVAAAMAPDEAGRERRLGVNTRCAPREAASSPGVCAVTDRTCRANCLRSVGETAAPPKTHVSARGASEGGHVCHAAHAASLTSRVCPREKRPTPRRRSSAVAASTKKNDCGGRSMANALPRRRASAPLVQRWQDGAMSASEREPSSASDSEESDGVTNHDFVRYEASMKPKAASVAAVTRRMPFAGQKPGGNCCKISAISDRQAERAPALDSAPPCDPAHPGTAGGCVGAVARSGCSPVEAGVCEDAAERTRLSGCARGSSETDLEAEEGSSACNDAEVEEEGAARAGDAVQSQAWTDEMAQIGHDDAVAQSAPTVRHVAASDASTRRLQSSCRRSLQPEDKPPVALPPSAPQPNARLSVQWAPIQPSRHLHITLERGASGFGIGFSRSNKVTSIDGRTAAANAVRIGDQVVRVNGQDVPSGAFITELIPPESSRVALVLVRSLCAKDAAVPETADGFSEAAASEVLSGQPCSSSVSSTSSTDAALFESNSNSGRHYHEKSRAQCTDPRSGAHCEISKPLQSEAVSKQASRRSGPVEAQMAGAVMGAAACERAEFDLTAQMPRGALKSSAACERAHPTQLLNAVNGALRTSPQRSCHAACQDDSASTREDSRDLAAEPRASIEHREERVDRYDPPAPSQDGDLHPEASFSAGGNCCTGKCRPASIATSRFDSPTHQSDAVYPASPDGPLLTSQEELGLVSRVAMRRSSATHAYDDLPLGFQRHSQQCHLGLESSRRSDRTRTWQFSALAGDIGDSERRSDSERRPADRFRRSVSKQARPSLSLGLGSASMYDETVRSAIRRASLQQSGCCYGSGAAAHMAAQLCQIQNEIGGEVQAVSGAVDSEEDELADEMMRVCEHARMRRSSVRPRVHGLSHAAPESLVGLMSRAECMTELFLKDLLYNSMGSGELLLGLLTCPSWQGVSLLLAIEDFVGWEVPEYHQLLLAVLCAYKPYLSAEALFGELSRAYSHLRAAAASRLSAQLVLLPERILYVLNTWVRDHADDFDEDLLNRALHFTAQAKQNEKVPSSITSLLDALQARLEAFEALEEGSRDSSRRSLSMRAESESRASGSFGFGMRSPMRTLRRARSRGSDAGSARTGLVDYWQQLFSAGSHERALLQQLAEQLALFEHDMLCQVQASELQQLNFAKIDKAVKSKNVMRICAHFNTMSRWVCHQVVSHTSLRERVRALRLFIGLAKASAALRNFNAAMEVVAALNSAAVFRLRRTWEALPKAAIRDFEQLDEAFKPERSHAALRAALKNAPLQPTVAYLGIYLTDLTFIEDGNPDFLPPALNQPRYINFAKCLMVGKEIREVMDYKKRLYMFQRIASVQDYFSSLKPPDDDSIYAQSLSCEPRAQQRVASSQWNFEQRAVSDDAMLVQTQKVNRSEENLPLESNWQSQELQGGAFSGNVHSDGAHLTSGRDDGRKQVASRKLRSFMPSRAKRVSLGTM